MQFVRRGPAAAPLMTATYAYFDNDLVQSVTYGNGASTWYSYDAAQRVTQIQHKASGSPVSVILQLDYSYTANDLPLTIAESGSSGSKTTYFGYDKLRRLTHETRSWPNGTGLEYQLDYQYDKGGNRTLKTDYDKWEQVVYHYDVHWAEEPGATDNPYGTFNNRLEWSETLNILEEYPPYPVLSTTWYYYKDAAGKDYCGNVNRIVSHEDEGAVMENMTSPGGAFEGTSVAPGEGGAAAPVAPPAECPNTYTATRFEYAKNGETVTYVMGEQWCWDGNPASCPTNYTKSYAREFRYDGARARYMNRQLSPSFPYTPIATTWSDYDGDNVYGDFTTAGSIVTNTDSYQPGLWRRLKVGTNFVPEYLHNDHLGTLRGLTDSTGVLVAGSPRAFTAFGEQVGGASYRFGYVGAFGYQSTPIPESPTPDPFPFLHVGARYYDPSSGRFLQRDPIGIRGGVNVYRYGRGQPTNLVDPDGLWSWGGFAGGVGVGVGTGARAPGLTKVPGMIVGALICGIAGGLEKDDPQRLWDKVKETVDDYNKRTQPQPVPPPPANKTPAVFERPWDEKYRGSYSSGAG